MTNAQAALLLLQGLIVIASIVGVAVLWMAVRYEIADQRRRRRGDNVTRITDYTRRRGGQEAA